MGLRINTNISGIRALRNLHVNDRNQQRSLERLSTGLRINRASDDPAGLVISERLRAQIAGQKQAVENTQNANNLISVADSALKQVSDLLIDIQGSVVFAQNTGGSSPEQIAAEQDAVDQAIVAIDRIGSITRYADRGLLNGQAGFVTSTPAPAAINDLRIRSLSFAQGVTQKDIDVEVTVAATQALEAIGAVVGDTIIRITGSRGTADVFLASGAAAADVQAAVNAVGGSTGVYSDGVSLLNETYGTDSRLTISTVTGSYAGRAAGATDTFTGVDAEVEFEGQNFVGNGNTFKINTLSASMEFNLAPGTAPAVLATFTVDNTGLTFQVSESPFPSSQISVGIDAISASALGIEETDDEVVQAVTGGTEQKGGFLTTLKAGSANDLSTNPANAGTIVSEAVDQVSKLRAFLGAIQANNLEPQQDVLEVSIENLSASMSDIRDLDFAEETSEFTKTQILYQAGTAVLASANLIPQTVLTLLQ